MFPEERYSVPPAPCSLNWGAYLPDELAYQDIRQHPALLTIAYCQCLQHWAEKHNLPKNPDFRPLAESVRELRQAIHEFVNITWEDVIKGLEMEEPEGGHQTSPTTIFSHVLNPLADRQEVEGILHQNQEQSCWVHPSNPEVRARRSLCASCHLFNESTNYRARWQKCWERPETCFETVEGQPFVCHAAQPKWWKKVLPQCVQISFPQVLL